MVHRSCAVGIEQGRGVPDYFGSFHGGEAEGDPVFKRNLRANFHEFREGSEPRAIHLQSIEAEGETSCGVVSFPVCAENLLDLIGLADQLNRGFHSKTCGVSHCQTQFAPTALCQQGESAEQENCPKSSRLFLHQWCAAWDHLRTVPR